MQIQPSLWRKLRRVCLSDLDRDRVRRSDFVQRLDQSSASICCERHPPIADVLSTLSRSPNAVEHGLLIGSHLPITAYGVPSLGILTAPTVGDGLRFIAEVHRLLVPLIDLSYDESPSGGRLTIGFRCAIDAAGEALMVAACTAAIERAIFGLCGRVGTITRLDLTPSSRGNEATYRKHLSVTPHTDGMGNTLVISSATLGLQNAQADIDTFNSVIQACRAQAERRIGRTPLQARVREIVMSRIGAPPSQEAVARRLELTPRQLRQHLEREGSSFQKIVRGCRTEYATTLLQNPSMSLSQVADRLGYSELSSFSHAFLRWTGKYPSAFRFDIHPRSKAA